MKNRLLIIVCYIILISTSKINVLAQLKFDSALKKKVIVIPANKYLFIYQANVNKIKFDSTLKIRILNSNKRYIEKATIFYNDYSFMIESNLVKDSVAQGEHNQFNPICTKQTIYFYKAHKLISKFDFPVNSIIQKISSGKKQRMLENVITSMGIIKSKNGVKLVIEGSGGQCGTCSSYNAFYNLKGKCLALNYGVEGRTSYYKVGSIYQFIKKQRINKIEYEQMYYSWISVYNYEWWIG